MNDFNQRTTITLAEYLSKTDNTELDTILNLLGFGNGLLNYVDTMVTNDEVINTIRQKKIPKATIFNWTPLDYFKMGFLTRGLDRIIYSAKQYNVVISSSELEQLLTKYNQNIYNKYRSYIRAINNRFIANVFAAVNDIDDLLVIEDKRGDTHQLSSGAFVDLGSRDAPFIYVNDEFLKGNPSSIHSQLLSNYIEKVTKNPTDFKWARINKLQHLYDIIEKNDNINIEEELLRRIETEPLIFGNIKGKLGFILSCKNINKKTAAALVKEYYQLDKVYFQETNLHKYTRLAKLILSS